MRANGLTNFPDPSGGGGLNLDGTGINPASPAFQTAQSKCQKLLPGGGPGGHGPPTKQAIQQMVAISRCMRAHGVTGFPDPTLTPLSPGELSKYSLAENRGGVILAVPKTIAVSSPGFQQAASLCGLIPRQGNKATAP